MHAVWIVLLLIMLWGVCSLNFVCTVPSLRKTAFIRTARFVHGGTSNTEQIRNVVQNWVNKWVILHGLCPWASSINRDNKLRIVVQAHPSKHGLQALLETEKQVMMSGDTPTESTLIVVPKLVDFYAFLDYVDTADTILKRKGWAKDLQIATFHPDYQFEGAEPDDVSNYTNRSPYPILHLLKVDQVANAIARTNGCTDFVWENNIRRLRGMGIAKVRQQLDEICTQTSCPERHL